MPSALAITGTMSYNGLSFTHPNTRIVHHNATPVYDDAGRTVVYVRYTVGISTEIQATAPTTTDADVATMRKTIMKSGGQLTLTGSGLGTISVNDGSIFDAAWGPKPVSLDFIHNSPHHATAIWIVSFCIPLCASGTPAYRRQPLAFNYGTTHRVDKHGRSFIAYAGYVEIPMTRTSASSVTLPDMVDAYRSITDFPRLDNCERTYDYRVNLDKRRLDFVITDTELANPPHPDAAEFTFNHSVSSGQGGSIFQFLISLSMSFTPRKGKTIETAWDYWIKIIRTYTPESNKAIPVSLSMSTNKAGGEQTLIASYSFNFTPNIKAAGAKDNFGHLTNIDFGDLFKQTKFFEKLIDTNFAAWSKNMRESHGPYGRLGIGAALTPASDVIVDLCTRVDPSGGYKNFVEQVRTEALRGAGKLPTPEGDGSWLKAELSLTIEADSTSASSVHTSIGASDATYGIVVQDPSNILWRVQLRYYARRVANAINDIDVETVEGQVVRLLEPPWEGKHPPETDAFGNTIHTYEVIKLYGVPGLAITRDMTFRKLEIALGPSGALPPNQPALVFVTPKL